MNDIKRKWHKVPKFARVISYVFFGIIAALVMGFLFGIVIQLLWNWLMPELFNLKEITYWQAIGIFLLAKLIFGFGSTGSQDNSPKKVKQKSCEEDNTKPYSKWRQWEYYDEWWEQEGKEAFNGYLGERKERKLNNEDEKEKPEDQ